MPIEDLPLLPKLVVILQNGDTIPRQEAGPRAVISKQSDTVFPKIVRGALRIDRNPVFECLDGNAITFAKVHAPCHLDGYI